MIEDEKWLVEENKRRMLNPPTENSIDSFVQKVGQRQDDIKNNQSIEIIRGFVYRSIYLWGGCGDMPSMIKCVDCE